MELLRVADLLVEKIKKDYIDDVACVVIMGSYIYNATHHLSDLDLYYIPKTERGKNLGKVFIINGVGFDFWPISWNRLERIADYEERITSIITEGRIIYYATDNDLDRFNQLKLKALDTSDKVKFTNKAKEKFNETYKAYFKLLDAENISDVRIHAMSIIFSLSHSIALLNRDTIKRGRGKLKKEIMDMPLVPKDFTSLYDTVFESADVDKIKNSYGQLIRNMDDLILKVQLDDTKQILFSDKLSGYYEELINFYNKIYHACEIGDSCTALFASVELVNEIEDAFCDTGISAKQLPDIVGAFNPSNSELFLEMVYQHQEKVVELLESNGVEIKVIKDFDELENFIRSL